MTTMNTNTLTGNAVMDEISINTINMNTLNNPLNLLVLEFYEPDFTNFLRQHFSKEAIEEVISKHRIGEVVTWEYISVDQSSYWFKKGYPCESKVYSHEFDIYMTYKGKEWTSKETKPAYKFYIPQKHTPYMADIIRELIFLTYPWMKEFRFNCYSWEYNTKNYEFYLTCDNGKSMYVPMSTLTEHNPKIAEKRTVTYYNDYYRWPGGWGRAVTEADVMKWRKENTVDLIESKTWKKFCDYLTK